MVYDLYDRVVCLNDALVNNQVLVFRAQLADAVLRERLEPRGIKVVTMLPVVPIPRRAKGVDWNDVLIGQGLFGFPRKDYLRRLCAKPQGGIQHAV